MAVMLSTAAIASACSEDELIALAREGDDRAFEELYSRYRERIGAFIAGRIHDHGRAEDIAQEVFMSALRRLRSSEQAIAFKPWIYEIAKNACIDEFRRNRRSREVSLDADDQLIVGPRAIASIAPTPLAAVENRQSLSDLRGAFGGLSESHHQLLVLREFEGLSYDEIAGRTGMSRQMVESALFRARRKLAEEYEELASGRRCHHVQTLIDDGRLQSRRSLGIRQRRQLARHLAHCQPCRMTAHLAGVDEALLRPRSIADKIAVLFPFGLWHWPWRGGGRSKHALHRTGAHPFAVHCAQNATTVVGSGGGASALGGAAIAAAVIAAGGAGGAVVAGLEGHNHAAAPAAVRSTGAVTRGAADHNHNVSRAAVRHAVMPGTSHHASVMRPSHRRAAKSAFTGRRHGSGPGAPPSYGSTSSSASGGSRSTSSGSAAAGSTVSQTAKRATSTVTSGTQKTVKQVTNTVSGATNTVNKVTQGATGAVNGAVNGVTGSVNHATGAVTGAVNQATGGATAGVTGAVNQATGTVTGAVTQATGSATGGVDNAVHGVTGTVRGVVHGLTGSL